MAPTAFSIVVEQIVRIGFLLLGAFIVMKVLDGTIRLAVGLAAFAALLVQLQRRLYFIISTGAINHKWSVSLKKVEAFYRFQNQSITGSYYLMPGRSC
ncbi:hypothetical protein [Piscibacillus salipiscarius]|uniref:hypothetical protein n=1 Tax=Piscibacillus salipiscarius TaxID=299480 RepID=UPI0034E2DFF6